MFQAEFRPERPAGSRYPIDPLQDRQRPPLSERFGQIVKCARLTRARVSSHQIGIAICRTLKFFNRAPFNVNRRTIENDLRQIL